LQKTKRTDNVNPELIPLPLHQKVQKIFNRLEVTNSLQIKRHLGLRTTIPYYSMGREIFDWGGLINN